MKDLDRLLRAAAKTKDDAPIEALLGAIFSKKG